MQTKLAIAIPTYNRAEILKFNLLQILDELIDLEIPVYISDDSVNDETRLVISELYKKHPLFFYCKNTPSLGHDLNCITTIELPKEDYVWYLGDSIIINKGSIEKILSIIKDQDFDFISCNTVGRINMNYENKIFDNSKDLFENLCWHLTMTGVTIYNRKKLFDIRGLNLIKYKNFPQVAIIFEQFSKDKASLFWINERLISGNTQKSSYWANKVFEVFIDDYRDFVHNLPNEYSIESKEKVVLMHTVLAGIFNYHSFIKYRICGVYDYKIFLKYKVDFGKYTDLNINLLFGIAIFPKLVLKGLYNIVFILYRFFK